MMTSFCRHDCFALIGSACLVSPFALFIKGDFGVERMYSTPIKTIIILGESIAKLFST